MLDTNSTRQIMRRCLRPDLSQYHVELVAVNVRVTTMYQRMARNQSDANVSTLLMTIQKSHLTSVLMAAHVKHSGVHTPAVVENQHMHTRLVL